MLIENVDGTILFQKYASGTRGSSPEATVHIQRLDVRGISWSPKNYIDIYVYKTKLIMEQKTGFHVYCGENKT